jgi:hypothetical protein
MVTLLTVQMISLQSHLHYIEQALYFLPLGHINVALLHGLRAAQHNTTPHHPNDLASVVACSRLKQPKWGQHDVDITLHMRTCVMCHACMCHM